MKRICTILAATVLTLSILTGCSEIGGYPGSHPSSRPNGGNSGSGSSSGQTPGSDSGSSSSGSDKDPAEASPWKYLKTGYYDSSSDKVVYTGGISLTGYTGNALSGNVILPSKVDGQQVTEIGTSLFSGNSSRFVSFRSSIGFSFATRRGQFWLPSRSPPSR